MVEALEGIKKKFMSLPDTVQRFVRDSFEENDSVVEDMNIEQLQDGKRSDGVTMPDYSPTSVEVFGKPPGPIKLFDTGAFQRGITLTAGTDAAILDSTDSKTNDLKFEYGSEIIGLSEENAEKFKNDYIQPSVLDSIKKFFS